MPQTNRAGDVVEARLDFKNTASRTIENERVRIAGLSRDLHSRPEVAFTEHYACERVSDELESMGFGVTRRAYGMATAFEATYGNGEFRVVLCAEYDALPEIGHACGHNVIAAISVGAALALRPIADELGLQVVVLGTPAEEHGGGKVALLRAGAFESAVMSAMVHPWAGGTPARTSEVVMLCVDRIVVEFTGRAAHAASAPHEAVNAAAAATIAEVSIGLMRQQLRDGIRIAAITTSAGTVTNVVPGFARLEVEVRARELADMNDTTRRLLACIEGAAIATGCSWDRRRSEPRYLSIDQDPLIAQAWDTNIDQLGPTASDEGRSLCGSTDMGNVSRVVPSIHPMINLDGAAGPVHTVEFAHAAGSEAGDECAITGATALAWTIIDLVSNPHARNELLHRAALRPTGATMVDHDDDSITG
ncbi:amidohydrolase [Rhodococcus jostii]|uniref:Peptidase M20 domain-containing protein 2 n=1 Tax=Rhodococcus jostii TaxID=132919 RepID=A0A1H4QX03_RHOJO|nr:amidohydrolase [Rhodococcus jostii]SEC24024.1 amidohydrolase [Rhodococcus jostii]